MNIDTLLAEFSERDWDTEPSIDQPVRFALIGIGWWTVKEAIPAIEDSRYCETSVLASRSGEKAEQVATEHDIPHGITYEEYHTGECIDEYDAVYVATPNGAHLEFVESAAAHGKNVLCEKPMEKNVERAERLTEACRDADVTLMIAYRMQTEPVVRRARELLADGIVGNPVQIHSQISIPLLDHGTDPDHWKLDPEAGGGAMLGVGVYPLNTTRFLLDSDPVRVSGTTWSPDSVFADVEEHVAFRAVFPDDIVAQWSASHNAHNASHLRVIGEAGEVLLEPIFHVWDERKLTIRHGTGKARIAAEQVNQMVEEFDYFGHCLLTDREPYATGEHGLMDMRVIEAAKHSAEDKEDIAI